ncbi:recombinase family protein [Methylobacterium sp. NI91]|nr:MULTISPECIES: recombinase family protein [unclassified Methylobacterium]QIJ74607.1 recombinase family protein [Methylobacterium sp. CLZ]QIJ79512.1 recombinase family protein [Methylobacterium sp. NI91]
MPVQRFAVSYLRFSHRRQASGDTMRRQIAACEAYVKRQGLTLLDTFADKGVSGFHGKHATKGDLSRLIALIDGGKLPANLTLIIENIDRLSREPMMGALGRFTYMINKGVSVVCLDIPDKVFNTASIDSDPTLLNSIIMMMQRGRNESEAKSKRVAESFTARFEKARQDGLAIKGYRGPAWLKIENRRYIEHPERCEVVREIFRLRIAGLGDYSIAARLNERRVPTFPHCAKRSKGAETAGWYPSYIGKILASRAVLGEFDPRGEGRPFTYFPKVVTPAVWADAQNMRRTRRTAAYGARGTKHHNLFMGIVRCAHCGGTMTMTQNRPNDGRRSATRYLVCSNRRRRAAACEAVGMINYPTFEAAVLRYLPQIPWAEIVERENPGNPLGILDGQIAAVRDDLQRLKEMNDNLTAAVAAAQRPLPALMMALESTADQVDHAEERLIALVNERATKAATLRPGLVKDAIEFADAMARASDTERFETRARLARALSQIITNVEFNVEEKTAKLYVSKSFTIELMPKFSAAIGVFRDVPSVELLRSLKPGCLIDIGGTHIYIFDGGSVEVMPGVRAETENCYSEH